jgi:lantibiotic modifying enzyme
MWNPPLTSLDYLQTARSAAEWIRSVEVPVEGGLTWLPEPDHPEKVTTISAAQTIYSGNAGIVLFFLELAKATGDRSYLDEAVRGADVIAATWREALVFPFMLSLPSIDLDVNHGVAGTAFVLHQAWLATGKQGYLDTAREIAREIVSLAKPAGAGIEWAGAPAAGLGDGAITLFLLWAADALGDPTLIGVATRAGDRILEQAEVVPEGLKWVGFPMETIGSPDLYMPNFEFGTAGVAFTLARLYEATGQERFLDAAKKGTAHVQAISTVRGDSALLFHNSPHGVDLYYLGYCAGPVGTARLFYVMERITGDGDYRAWLEKFAHGIIATGAPERQTPGLWNVVCQCCGTAGVLDFFLSVWRVTGKQDYLDFARRVGATLLGQAVNLDGKGARWYQAWTRTKPADVTAETGYMIGAGGVGASLLHLYLAEEGRYEAVLFPDNPFPPNLA